MRKKLSTVSIDPHKHDHLRMYADQQTRHAREMLGNASINVTMRSVVEGWIDAVTPKREKQNGKSEK